MAVTALLTILALASVFFPQPAYIHPDEFFQSTEILAGDVFNISHLRTWEWAPEQPLRDAALPTGLFAPALHAMKHALQALPADLKISGIQVSTLISESYLLLVLPRLVVLLLGILNYRLVKKLCRVFELDSNLAAWYWLTSFATWTFLARPFSNTVETALFSLAWLVLLDIAQSSAKVSAISTKTPSDVSLIGSEEGKVRRCSFLLGCIVCMGIFNRPTFVIFMSAPLLWWFDQVCKVGVKTTILSVIYSKVGFCLTGFGLVVANSVYYNPVFLDLLKDLYTAVMDQNTSILHFILTALIAEVRIPPLNFLQYNLKLSNLAEHGLHVPYTHGLINFPLLLGPLALLFVCSLLCMVRHCCRRSPRDVLYASVLMPLLCLSFFPHQEARFLLPILPLATVCASANKVAKWKTFRFLTFLFSLTAFAMFGWLHQGGVVPALSSLQKHVHTAASSANVASSEFHVISYATYMPPRHLLFNEKSSKVSLHIHDMIDSHNPSALELKVKEIGAACRAGKDSCNMFVLLPATAMSEVSSSIRVLNEEEFCPHVSMERLPPFKIPETQEDVFDLMKLFCLKMLTVNMYK